MFEFLFSLIRALLSFEISYKNIIGSTVAILRYVDEIIKDCSFYSSNFCSSGQYIKIDQKYIQKKYKSLEPEVGSP